MLTWKSSLPDSRKQESRLESDHPIVEKLLVVCFLFFCYSLGSVCVCLPVIGLLYLIGGLR